MLPVFSWKTNGHGVAHDPNVTLLLKDLVKRYSARGPETAKIQLRFEKTNLEFYHRL